MEVGGGQSVDMLDQLACIARPGETWVLNTLDIILVGKGEPVGTPGQRQNFSLLHKSISFLLFCLVFWWKTFPGFLPLLCLVDGRVWIHRAPNSC